MIRIVIDCNNIRDGHVISLHGPPPGLAEDIARAASNNREVVAVTVDDESGYITHYVRGDIISAGFFRSEYHTDKPNF